ncbi:MAG: hypothetical protein AB1782_03595 [Cyanobacteriota bacterium]
MSQKPVKNVDNSQPVVFQPVKIGAGNKTIPEGNKAQRNVSDLGTSGCAFSGMYLGNAMQVAADKTRVNIDPNKIKTPEPQRIVVLDNFQNKMIDIDGDNIDDLSHGEVVEKYILANNPSAEIVRMEIKADEQGKFRVEDYTRQMNALADRIEAGEHFDAVNISLAREIDLSNNKKITPGNVKDNEVNIRQNYLASGDNAPEIDQMTRDYIKATERVTALGPKVYIAAGNKFNDGYNMFGLAQGTTQVGTISTEGDTILARNSDIERYEQGQYYVDPVFQYDKLGNESIAGYDINEDGHIDVNPQELSSKGKLENYTSLTGSSFSTPTAVGKDTDPIRKILGQ